MVFCDVCEGDILNMGIDHIAGVDLTVGKCCVGTRTRCSNLHIEYNQQQCQSREWKEMLLQTMQAEAGGCR